MWEEHVAELEDPRWIGWRDITSIMYCSTKFQKRLEEALRETSTLDITSPNTVLLILWYRSFCGAEVTIMPLTL